MNRAAILPLALLTGCAAHQHGSPHEHGAHHGHSSAQVNHRFENAEQWAQRFEDPARDAWQKPDEVVKLLGLKEDALVADIGAATGYFPVRVARAVPKGTVYGVDVEASMVEYLGKRAVAEKLPNLKAVLGAFDDPKLPEVVDLVMLVDTWHHIDGRADYFRKVALKVKPGGRLVVIDFKKTSPMGPPAASKFEPAQVTQELLLAGWTLSATHEVLPEQFFLVYTRP